jgi:DNA-binding MarR family transcriptional regulator/predicted N-acetyltransferase YhbS
MVIAPPTDAPPTDRIERLRRFNRFYTRLVGALEEHLLQSPFSLAEARVLYELAHRSRPTASEIAEELGIDAGYLSRILRRLGKLGLVERARSAEDRRVSPLSLTGSGEAAFARLEANTRAEVARWLEALSPERQDRLFEAVRIIEDVLGGDADRRPRAYLLRPPRPGELGWVVSRHGALYGEEHGWDRRFEALVAGIVSAFGSEADPDRESCWIAEMDGEPVGSVLVTRASDAVAQLRLLLVEPRARGLGIGSRLVEECIRFARRAGYATLRLWTQSNLDAAREIYVAAGFRRVQQERHRSFGPELTAETWELTL